jgi:hypothetical protein
MKTFERIAIAFTLAFFGSIPLAFVVVGLGGTSGYTDMVQRLPVLWLCAYWLLGRLRSFKAQ